MRVASLFLLFPPQKGDVSYETTCSGGMVCYVLEYTKCVTVEVVHVPGEKEKRRERRTQRAKWKEKRKSVFRFNRNTGKGLIHVGDTFLALVMSSTATQGPRERERESNTNSRGEVNDDQGDSGQWREGDNW